MADNNNEHVVIAMFADQTAAGHAVDSLKSWDRASSEIKLGAIGTITKDGNKVSTHVGRKTGKGASVGAILGVIAAILSGGITLLGGVVGGAALGGVIGAFLKQSLQLTEEEIQSLGRELDGGKVALVVLCDTVEIEPVTTQLASLGGQIHAYDVPREAVAATTAALAAESTPVETTARIDAETV
jgi:uncharacterized membrane protein